MKLNKLTLQNFRAFEQAVVTFPQSGVLMIAGANNSGKSALLSGIDAMVGGNFGPETRHYGSDEVPQIKAAFTLEDEERRNLLLNASDGIGSDFFSRCSLAV